MPKQTTWAVLWRSNTFYFSLFRNARLSTKLYETADVTSNLGRDLVLLESIECESPTSEVESENRTRDRERSYSEPEDPYIDKLLTDEY